MDTINCLREALLRVLSAPDSHNDDQDLFGQLMVHKSQLQKLFDVGPSNPQERREVETGKPTINGKPTSVNTDFARQTIFLAQQLECSENYIAGILYQIMTENPNIDPVNCMERVVSTFHKRRQYLVDSLRFLLDATEAAEFPEAPQNYKRLANFVLMELLPGSRDAAAEVTFAQKVFKWIEKLDVDIGKAEMAKKNAGSNTVAPPVGQGNPALGYDILNARYDSLRFERRSFAIVLCSISRLGHLSPDEIKLIIEWLSSSSSHPLTLYLLTAVFLSFDPIDPNRNIAAPRQTLSTDSPFMTFMTKKFGPSSCWKDTGLKATILLKWTLFLTEARYNDTTLEHRSGFKNEELEAQIWTAVQGDAFTYLARSVVHIQGTVHGLPALLFNQNLSDQQDQREVPPPEFKDNVLMGFETLVRSLITHASSELRKIKQRQEDLVLVNSRSDRTRTASRFASTISPETDKPGPPPRHDIAMLYSFIGLLYAALPAEKPLQFWGSSPQQPSYRTTFQEAVESTSGRLPAFLQWAVWSTSPQDKTMLAALYDMLSGLANGQQCSELAYNFMARGGGEVLAGSSLSVSSTSGPSVSWTAIFSLLDSWAFSASNPRSHPQPQPSGLNPSFSGSFQSLAPPQPSTNQPFMISPKDVIVARSFLRVLATVVTHSVAVRTTIASHVQFKAIPTLVSLIPLGIPLELKGSVFDTLAAFCEPGAGVPGVEICKAVWGLMEKNEVINVRTITSGGFGASLAVKGVEVELEQVEAPHRQYPATIPFLKVLGTLIHTPQQISMHDRAAGNEPLDTIPDALGQPYRLPGIGPYTSFVIDNVFNNINNREYSRPSDRWEINDLCLRFIEKSLAGFNLELLVNAPDGSPLTLEHLVPLLIHPGYDILKRLLTNSPLQSKVLSYIVDGLSGFEKGYAEEQPFFRNTIIRVLRIVDRILQVQDIFLDVFIPLLSDFNSSAFVGQIHSRSYFIKFDQALAFGAQFIPALAAYISYPAYSELALLSTKIIAKLSLSLSPSTLVTLIERSPDSERILSGFMRIMNTESMEDVAEAEEFMEQKTGAGAPDIDPSSESLEQAIRLSALNFLIQDTDANRPYPNIAHFLLFGGKPGDQTIQDPHALGARQTSIHVLLDMINAGVPRLRGKRKTNERLDYDPLFNTLPTLAERCYRVIYQLCIHPKTSDFTTRYLRTREDFFARQVARIPSSAPETLQDPPIQVQYGDGSRVTTTVPSLTSFLRLQSYIFNLVALELHVLTNKGHHKAVSELLEILFGSDFEYEEEHDFPTFHELGQSPMRIIDFLQSLMLDWADSLYVEPLELKYLGQLNLQSCIRRDAAGCEIVDRTAVLHLLNTARRTLYAQGNIATTAQNEELSDEFSYILESCAVENHRREVSHARAGGFQAWRNLLDLALTKCFDRLPLDRRENMLFDLLHVLPTAIRSSNIEEPTAILLSETILSTVTKLREDRRHQAILQSMGGDSESGSLPAERLFNILRNVLEGILDNNHVELVRGNLYAALINLIHLVRSSPISKIPNEVDVNPFTASLSMSMNRDLSMSMRKSTSVTPSVSGERFGSTLEVGCLTVMKPMMERLVTTISRDAIDGTEVWKTVAFMLLDAIVQLSSLERQHSVLSALSRHGVLPNFVRGIKDSDSRLQGVLKPDPDDLNSLYVYEAKMSLFIRMAQTRAGVERLLEAQLLPILAQCDYLDARPEADQSFIDQDSFLPSAVQRYHQLFMPALQVVDAMLATLGNKHTTATHQALEFLSAHGSTIAILLKNDAEYVNLPTLEEVHLIIALCTSVLPSVPKTEVLSPNSGFGAIHLAILNLSTKCLARGKVFLHIIPQSDLDIKLSSIHAFGYGNQTKFDVKIRRKERLLRKSVVSYIGAASEFTEPEITLVLSPITIMPKNEERASHLTTTVPTVGSALIALDDLCHDLAETLKQISDISAELAQKHQMGLDNVQEILQEIDPALLRDLELEQQRSLLHEELEHIRSLLKNDAKVILDTLEMLLLLLWRHVDYYAEPSHMNMPPVKATITNAMRLLATSEPEVFRQEVAIKIQPVLQRLEGLQLDSEELGHDWQDNQGYIQIMTRRLRDSAGLHDEPTMEGESD